jgi:hypothetical protein
MTTHGFACVSIVIYVQYPCGHTFQRDVTVTHTTCLIYTEVLKLHNIGIYIIYIIFHKILTPQC